MIAFLDFGCRMSRFRRKTKKGKDVDVRFKGEENSKTITG